MGSSTSQIKSHRVNSTTRLPSGFEHELDDELATALPAAGMGVVKQIRGVKQLKPDSTTPPPSTAPATLYSSKRKQGVVSLKPKQQQSSMAPQMPTRVKDCIWVGGTANSEVTSTAPGLQRLEQVEDDSYESGTAAPRASARFISGLDALDLD
jgi:hypothetical protein